MSKAPTLGRRLFITFCLMTGMTDRATRVTGARVFLPALFVQRYARMGGLDEEIFAGQVDGARSFSDDGWCDYWDAIVAEQVAIAERIVPGISGASGACDDDAVLASLRDLLSPLGPRIADLLTRDVSALPSDLALDEGGGSQLLEGLKAVRALVRAITYAQVSAFPFPSPRRLRAYEQSGHLFARLAAICAPMLGLTVERTRIPVGGENVDGYAIFPIGKEPFPMVILTNGLEGTVPELAIPQFRNHGAGLALFLMEMPGTYSYRQPMSDASQRIYDRVIAHVAADPRVNADRIGFVGVSFGGFWAVRMAATSDRLRCAVACGAPTHRSFQMSGSLGTPEIIVAALRATLGATGMLDLGKKLGRLSLRPLYGRIEIPMLLINGDRDTLLSTQDSIDVAKQAPSATLKLYPDDDHCAMGHYDEWLSLSATWLQNQLLPTAEEAQRA